VGKATSMIGAAPSVIGFYSDPFVLGVSQVSDVGQRHLSKTKYP
jgi:hypothetical protein